MRKIIAAEFMTIDGVIQNEENDGDDSPLYGAMGFVCKSEKKYGLTRNKKP